jgi:galactonate dehydratase
MYHHGFWKGGFIYMSAISGIDMALWDILGKHFGVPVYQLLGGRTRDRIKTYTHAATAELAGQWVEAGFAGVKTGGGTPGGICDDDRCLPVLDERLSGIRKAIGDRVLAIDNHGQATTAMAIRQLAVAAKYHPYFFEEPIPPENPMEYKRIRANACAVPIAAGERLYSRFDCRDLIENQLVDFIQPDICHCGGISEIRRIASYAEVYHIKFAPHNPNGPVATAASLHVAASTHNFDILEFAAGSVYARQDVFNMAFKPSDGYFPLPEGPGLGIDLDESKFHLYPPTGIQYHPRYYPDGTVGEI